MFTNVKHLKEIQQQTRKNRSIKQLLVLLSRIFAFAALVFLFAQPFIPDKDVEVKQGDKLVSIYLDNSFSMAAESESGPLLEVAKSKCNDILKAYSETDKFQIITNDFSSSSARFLSKLDAQAIIDDVQISPSSKELADIVLKVKETDGANQFAIREAYLLSDFQNHELPANFEKDSNIRYSGIYLQSKNYNNVSIDSVWFESPFLKTGDPLQAVVLLSNRGNEDLESISLKLFVDGQQKMVQSIDLKAGSKAEIPINFSVQNGGWKSAELAIEDHPIQYDDHLFFAFNVRSNVSILEIYDSEPNAFIRKLYQRDDFFRHSASSKTNLDYSTLANFDFVILNEVQDISSGLNTVLLDFLSAGGTVAIIPSATSNSALRSKDNVPFYNFSKELGTNTDVIRIDNQSNLMRDVFETIPRNIDLPKVNKSYKISSSNVFYKDILGMSNQEAFLAEIKLESGRVFVQAVPLSSDWSNFQQHALFVPIYLKMAFAGSAEYPYDYTIGENELIQTASIEKQESAFKIKNESIELTPELWIADNRVYLNEGKQITEQNSYDIVLNDSLIQKVAFNYSRRESIAKAFEQDELAKDLEALDITFYDQDSKKLSRAVQEQQSGNQLWRWFALLSLFFIAIEILLLRFWPKG